MADSHGTVAEEVHEMQAVMRADEGDREAVTTPIRVFLVDDHELVRRGLRELLEDGGDVVVVGEAGTADEALRRIAVADPDVAVLDVRLPDGNGVDVCREVRQRMPHVACLMLSSFAADDDVVAAIRAGAAGYVLKRLRGDELVDSIRRIARGEHLLDPIVTDLLFEHLRRPEDDELERAGLSAQERRLLELIARGLTNREIGGEMGLAEKTVKNYVSTLLGKLGMTRRAEAAAMAARFDERHGHRHTAAG